jgi:hypothetical protein
MHVKEIYVIFIHLFDSEILLIIDLSKKKREKKGEGSKRQVWMSIFHIINLKKKKILDTGSCIFFNKKLILDYYFCLISGPVFFFQIFIIAPLPLPRDIQCLFGINKLIKVYLVVYGKEIHLKTNMYSHLSKVYEPPYSDFNIIKWSLDFLSPTTT